MKGISAVYSRITLLITALCFCFMGFAWYSLLQNLRQSKNQAITAAIQRNDNLAVALEQYTTRTIEAADAKLQLVKAVFVHDGNLRDLDGLFSMSSKLLDGISITDENGRLMRPVAHGQHTGGTALNQTGYFRYHQQHNDNWLHISQTALSPISGKPAITLSRRISKADGSFGGMVLVQIAPAELTRVYASANLQKQELFSIIDLRGITYARRNGNRESWGENISSSRLLGLVAQNPTGNYFAPDVLHKIPTYFSYRKVPGYPVIVTCGIAESEVLASYRNYRQNELLSGVIITVLLLAFLALVLFVLRLRKKSEVAIKESEARYRFFFEHSIDAILITRPNGHILQANPAACAIFQMTEQELCAVGRGLLTDSSDPMLEALTAKRNAEGSVQGEITFRRKDGTTFSGEVASSLFNNAAGEAITTVIIRDVTERKQMQQQLLQQQKRIQRRITEQVIFAQEREREEIGRELHDNVNQVLTSAKLFLELALSDAAAAAAYINRSMTLILNSINEIRYLSRSLAAATLGTNSLGDAVNALAEMIQTSSGMEIRVEQGFDEDAVSKEQKLALYRMVQEQLTNIVKHAQATMVDIGIFQEAGQLHLTIRDNGQGFDSKAQGKGIGLNNIINRARVLDGDVNIDTAPGAGCTLSVSVPVTVC